MLRLPSPLELLRRARLRYFCTLVHMNQTDIWAISATDTEWKGLLEHDLVWMWEQLHNSSNLPDPRQGYDRWYDIIRQSPGYWKRLVKRAVSMQYFKGRDFSTSDCTIIRPSTPSKPCCKGMTPCNLQICSTTTGRDQFWLCWFFFVMR